MLLKMMLLKKQYNKLVTKVNNIDTDRFLLKATYNADKSKLENILAKTVEFSSKITELENKIIDVKKLATNSALTAGENKIPDISSLIIKTNETETKINNHNHDKYITTPESNTLVAGVFDARL